MVLRDFQDFPDRLVSKNVAPQHAWSRNEKERSGQLIAITAKLAARVPIFPTPIANIDLFSDLNDRVNFKSSFLGKRG